MQNWSAFVGSSIVLSVFLALTLLPLTVAASEPKCDHFGGALY
ncbi:MAG: hypothetical protein ACREMB_10565 [Candidatus Rokuibacteriota bacterium]